MQEFQLKVIPTDNNNFTLELYQCAYKKAGEKKRPKSKCIGKLKGNALVLARHDIYQILQSNNYDPKTLSYHRQTPYVLDEGSGVTLALLFQALNPLSRNDHLPRISNIAQGIMAMSKEESHYWFAKVFNGSKRNALKAIRVLLGG